MTKTESQKLRSAFQKMKQAQPKVKASQPKPKKKNGNSNPLTARSIGAAKGSVISKKLEVVNATRNKKFPGSVCIRGQEFIQSVAGTGASTGTNIVTQGINPVHFTGTRLAEYGKLYDKYLFTKMRFTFASGMSTGTSGQYILAYDRDYADTTPPATSEGLQQYYSMMNSKIANAWESVSIDCNLADFQEFYYNNDTGYEGRIVYQGQIYMAAVSGTTFTGALMLDYECEFYDPQLEVPDTTFVGRYDGSHGILSGSSIFDYVTPVYGQSSESESTKPWLWTDQDGEVYVSFPPGQWALDYFSTISYTGSTIIGSFTPTAFKLNKDALKSKIVDEVVNSLISISHALSYNLNPAPGFTGFMYDRFLLSIPPFVGRIALLVSVAGSFSYTNTQLSVVPISTARLLGNDLAPAESKRKVSRNTLSLSPKEEDSAVKPEKASESNANDLPEFIDPGQLELYKQFVRMQIATKSV